MVGFDWITRLTGRRDISTPILPRSARTNPDDGCVPGAPGCCTFYTPDLIVIRGIVHELHLLQRYLRSARTTHPLAQAAWEGLADYALSWPLSWKRSMLQAPLL